MYIWVNAFQQVWGRVRLNNFFWRGGGSEFLATAVINFAS